jgi:alkanesulfonate monooxygenase SsuD/methylene tetrahydromethanopterin reductase-like flavin-dependent oxidoreductase (luciferase family)
MDYGQPVRFGVFVIPHVLAGNRPLEIAQVADELDYDLVGVQDHPYQRNFFETWTLLTAMAMRTERISVFPDVTNLRLREPAVLAKAAASLDRLSGGRVELGLGAGGAADAVVAFGGPRRTPAEAVSALEEAIQVIRMFWTAGGNLRFDGSYYSLRGANAGPPPLHPVGIWLGAYRSRMLAITGRLADGWLPSFGYVKQAELTAGNERIDAAARAAGRDPTSIRRLLNIGLPPEQESAELLTSLVLEHGMDTFIVGEGDEDPRIHLTAFMREVVPRVRDAVGEARARR